MIDPLKMIGYARQIRHNLARGRHTIKTVVTQGGRHWLQRKLADFDLVDRQQFEQQQEQLQQLRKQLVQLEQQIIHLEKQQGNL